jgi:polyphosphate kinase
MKWSQKDKLLFHLLNQAGKTYFAKYIKESTAIFLKKKPTIVPFGICMKADKGVQKVQFLWLDDMNKTLFDYILKRDIVLFGSDETLKKLFHSTVLLDIKDAYVIPYVISITNPMYRVVTLKKDGKILFALMKADKPDHFDIDTFQNSLFLYRKYDTLKKR